MSKFCGVISKVPKNPSISIVDEITFTDMHFIVEHICADTRNLLDDFQRQADDVNQRDIVLVQNAGHIQAISESLNKIVKATIQIEDELDCCLRELVSAEAAILNLLKQPIEIKSVCMFPNSRQRFQSQLLEFSNDMVNMNVTMADILDERRIGTKSANNVVWRLIENFLKTYLETLEETEQNLNTLDRRREEIEEMLWFGYNRQSAC